MTDPFTEIREALDCLELTNFSGADNVERHVEIARAALARLEREAAEREAARQQAESVEKHLAQLAATVIERLREVEAERDRQAETLRKIAENAEDWHGFFPARSDAPGAGHVRALGVIARWARAVLASPEAAAADPRVACPECEGAGWYTAAEHDPRCNGSCDFCPVPVQRECETCNGSGRVPAAPPAVDAPSPGYFIPAGDERCTFTMDACTCMKRKGHDGLHACAHGGWSGRSPVDAPPEPTT